MGREEATRWDGIKPSVESEQASKLERAKLPGGMGGIFLVGERKLPGGKGLNSQVGRDQALKRERMKLPGRKG